MFGKKQKLLDEAIRQNNAEDVARYICGDHYIGCALAIEHGANDALSALLQRTPEFYFPPDSERSRSRAWDLVKRALSVPDSTPLLLTLYSANAAANRAFKISEECFLSEKTPPEFI